MRKAFLAALASLLLSLTCVAAAQPSSDERASVRASLNPSTVAAGGQATLEIVLDIRPGFHAQSHKPLDENLIPLAVTPTEQPAVEFGEPNYSEPTIVESATLGRLSVYTGRATVTVPVTIRPGTPQGPLTIGGSVRYQICDDAACFMPQTRSVAVQAEVVARTAPVTEVSRPMPSGMPTLTIPVAFGTAFLAGLLFNVMPCVLPVLPLKAMGFYEVAGHRRSQSVFFGLVFSVGVISVFAVLAVLVLVLDLVSWGGLFRQGLFVWPIVALLILLALGQFGTYTVMLPGRTYSFTPRHDTYAGNFMWGGLTAILATPCTAPLLPGLLAWAVYQPGYIGVPAMLMVGVGMACPYLVLSAMPELARRLPRVGAGAELFKQMMGFLMLAAAAYFAGGRLIHGPGFFWAVTAVVAVACFYLVGRTAQISSRAAAVALSSAIAVTALAGTLWWTVRVTGLLARPAAAPVSTAGGDSALTSGAFLAYGDEAFANARASGRPVLVKFTANWCATCLVIEGTVFQDAQVWAALTKADVVALKVDLTESGAPGEDLLLKLNPAGGIPLTAIYAPGVEQPTVLGSVYTSGTLLNALAKIKARP
jgi:thiol:disulfide interchange protein DsbD